MANRQKSCSETHGNRWRSNGCLGDEVSYPLDILDYSFLLCREEWEPFTGRHHKNYHDSGRTADSLKRKFSSLYRKKAPTGDPLMPENVRRANCIPRRMKEHCKLEKGKDAMQITDDLFVEAEQPVTIQSIPGNQSELETPATESLNVPEVLENATSHDEDTDGSPPKTGHLNSQRSASSRPYESLSPSFGAENALLEQRGRKWWRRVYGGLLRSPGYKSRCGKWWISTKERGSWRRKGETVTRAPLMSAGPFGRTKIEDGKELLEWSPKVKGMKTLWEWFAWCWFRTVNRS